MFQFQTLCKSSCYVCMNMNVNVNVNVNVNQCQICAYDTGSTSFKYGGGNRREKVIDVVVEVCES